MDVRKFDAERIGLCRTEHMFFDPMCIKHMREMILAEFWLSAPRAAQAAVRNA